ncbi:methyl-accepting chemotaxis protein [Geomesophilobacter sediminis]|uniref:HAMP domain-containing protein n=1 Tax=Geomesophilobacter sediminis TaxID=2798584 RepID=A0A8J7JG76_9BACT|nr:methyl-accepting chemotaxis protein [Geomesophilobacter sediminis]MBJ6723465.1 HAMP domain-containing protein [Geomesophilobacter sediminis]
MFTTIRSKLLLFSVLGLCALMVSVGVSSLLARNEIRSIMKADICGTADALEKTLEYIAERHPQGYKDPSFKRYINSVKIGESGYVYLLDESGTLIVHPSKEGANLAGEKHIDAIRSHRGNGVIEYVSTTTKQKKIAAYRYIDPWGVWVVPGVNEADYFAQLNKSLLKWNLTCGIVIMALFALASFFIIRSISRPLREVAKTANRISVGALNERVPVSGDGEIALLADAFNKMTGVIAKNLRDEVDKSSRLFSSIRGAITHLSGSASHLMAISTEQSSGSAQQASAVQEVSTTSHEIAVTARLIMENAQIVESLAQQSSKSCQSGTNDVADAAAGVVQLKSQVQGIARAMVHLGDNSQKIGGIVEIIDEISEQTNLLALNAAIEAAGAGEYGKRFNVVAQEVRRLAERTVAATRQISGLIEEIQKSTNSTIMVTEEGTKAADYAASMVDKVQSSFGTIIDMVDKTAWAAKEISLSTQHQTTACQEMAETMGEVRDVARQVASGAQATEQAVAELRELTGDLKEMIEEEVRSKGKADALRGAKLMEQMLTEMVTSGDITLDELFDENYEPIPGTTPQKYHTKYDRLLDERIVTYEDQILERDKNCIYAILVDRNSYCPTHNSKYQQELTGDAEQDRAGNRTKRFFDDPDEMAAARNTSEPLLIQIHQRDTGEKVWAIASPVYVQGRHWGAFRVGYVL